MCTRRDNTSKEEGRVSMVDCKNILRVFVSVLLCGMALPLHSVYNTNFFRAQDAGFLPLFEPEQRKFIAGAMLEYGGVSQYSYDVDGYKVPLLQAYTAAGQRLQNSQAMLSDPVITFPASEDPEQWFASTVQQTYNDQWGMFNVSGKFQEANMTFWGRGILPTPDLIPGVFSLVTYLPIKSLRVDSVAWEDTSDQFTLGGEERIIGFSSRLRDFVNNVGELQLSDWSKVGQGDLTVQLEWHNEFKRELDVVKSVRLDAALGLLIPTGRMVDGDVDQIFSIPLGSGGAWGLPARAGIEICFHPKISAGVSVDVLALSDITKTRRVKTHVNQTDYLLLTKKRVRLQHARTWRFSLFARAKSPVEGLSASVAYHFVKTGDHTLIADDNVLSNTVINTQEALKESSSHDIVFRLHFGRNDPEAITAPGITAFLKIPVGGRRMIQNMTFGGEFMFAF